MFRDCDILNPEDYKVLRDAEILSLSKGGIRNSEIAKRLGLNSRTVAVILLGLKKVTANV